MPVIVVGEKRTRKVKGVLFNTRRQAIDLSVRMFVGVINVKAYVHNSVRYNVIIGK